MDEDGERRKVGQGDKCETSSTEDSDSSESNFEDYNVLPYQCDPYFKNREDLEQFLKGCDNRVESNSDREDENVDLEGHQERLYLWTLWEYSLQWL